jgi:RND family efflux transporter MFP subunit
MIKKSDESNGKIKFRIIVCVIVLFVGFLGMTGIANMKSPPMEIKQAEPSLGVEVLEAKAEDVQVVIKGYGEVRALDVVDIAPEISGKIIDINPRLETGEIITKGDLIFKIDERDYRAAFEEASATVRKLENSLLSLEKTYETERERLKTIERNRDIAKLQYERVKRLFEEDKVGTDSGVNQAEESFNSASDQAEQMALSVELYPLQIREVESSLDSAKAKLATAKTNLERCVVITTFDGRVKDVSLEEGQYVSPGKTVVTLADDSILEILVSVDSRDANKWLSFNGEKTKGSTAWFNGLEHVNCKIHWTEADSDTFWNGTLHRVIKFNSQTRTLTVAARIRGEDVVSSDGHSLPLVEGMFCSVEIPGKTLKNVFRVPRSAINFENYVYMCIDGRLKSVPVEVARSEGEDAFISGGIKQGDLVITTRLVDPLENILINIL